MRVAGGVTDQDFPLRIIDSTDGTPETGVVAATGGLNFWYLRAGGSVVSLTESDLTNLNDAHSDGAFKHISDGYYRVCWPDAAFAAGVAWVLLGGSVTGMVVVGMTVQIGTAPADVTHWLGTAAATPTVAGVPEVDMTHLGGVAQSAADLKDFADDGYDPSTNKVQGVVLTDTLTTYTGNTPQTGDVFPLASTEIADIKAKTDQLTFTNAGKVDAAILAAGDFVQGAADKVWASAARSLTTFGTLVADIWANAARTLTSGANIVLAKGIGVTGFTDLSATQVEDAVWDAVLADHLDAGSTGAGLNAAGSAGDPWNTALPGAYGAGTAGKIIGDNVNATISSRATQTSVDTVDSNVDAILADTGTDGVVVAAASKTGYALSTAGVQAIWDALTSVLTAVGSIGKLLVDNIDDAISSRLATAGYTTPPTVGAIAGQVWNEALAGHLAPGSTGEALGAAGSAGDPWTTALPGAYGAGSAGKIVGDNLNAPVGDVPTNTELAVEIDSVQTDIAALNNPSAADIATAVWTSGARTLTSFGTLVADVATAVWGAAARTLTAFGFSVTVGTNNDKTGYGLSAQAVDDVWNESMETGATARESLRLANSANGGKTDGAGTATFTMRDLADTKDRVSATTDLAGNRDAVTRDLT